ncbi:protein of unknown function [Pararobbsia alpina]
MAPIPERSKPERFERGIFSGQHLAQLAPVGAHPLLIRATGRADQRHPFYFYNNDKEPLVHEDPHRADRA